MGFSRFQEYRLGDLLDSVSVKHNFNKEKLIFLNTSDVLEGKVLHSNYSEISRLPGQAKKSIKKGDILFSEIRPKNKRFAYIDFDAEDYVVSTKLMVLRKKSELVDNYFLYKFLTMEETLDYLQMVAEGRSGTFLQITFNELKNLKIKLPSIIEQKSIVKIILALDKKNEINNQINKKLEKMAQTIFKHWFIDFEFPNENGEPYKSSGGKMVESELGLIPHGWEVKTIGDVGEVVSGGTPSTKNEEFYNGDISWITPKDLSGFDRKFISKGEKNITRLGLEKSSAKLLPRNTVLFSSRAPIGYIALAEKEVCTNQGFKNIICNEKKVSPNFMYYFLKANKDAIESVASGSTFKEVSGTLMKRIKIVVPTMDVLTRFNNVVKSFDGLLMKNYKEIDLLINLRDSLLPKLMSGEIRVPLDN